MKNILLLLKKDGVFISESHYLLPLIKKVQYDTIYHEHLRYYSLSSLKNIFKKFDLKIFYAKEISTHGGSIRVYACRKENFDYKENINIKKLLKNEKKNLNWRKFQKFKKEVISSKFNLINMLNKIKKKNKIIYGVGAPSRASTLINYVGLSNETLDCICEIKNSHKIGYFLPGTNIPVVDEKIIFKKKPDYLLILSWHISSELILNLKKRGFKGKFIVPLPKPIVIN